MSFEETSIENLALCTVRNQTTPASTEDGFGRSKAKKINVKLPEYALHKLLGSGTDINLLIPKLL
jgi:hypothetical protein